MHESTTTTEVGLTEADLAAAHRRTIERGEALIRRRRARTAALGSLVVAVLLVGGFGVLRSMSEDRPVVVSPAGEGDGAPGGGTGTTVTTLATDTTSTPPTQPPPEVQPGYLLSIDGSAYVVTRTGPDGVTTSIGDGVAIGGGVAVERQVAVVAYNVIDDSHVEVTFACVGSIGNVVDEARYRIDGATIVVSATVSSGGAGRACEGGRGADVVLPFPQGGMNPDVMVVAGQV